MLERLRCYDPGNGIDKIGGYLGYRFQLDSVSHAQSIIRGQSMNVTINARNTGWARMLTSRKFVVTFKNQSTGATIVGTGSSTPGLLPRMMLAPSATSSTPMVVNVAIPAGAATGTYDVYISMPDIYLTTEGDARQAVHFANADDSSKGQKYDTSTALFKTGTVINVQ